MGEIHLLGWGRFQIEPDFSPEGAVDRDRVHERQAEGDDEPHQADLQTVSAGRRTDLIRCSETIDRVTRQCLSFKVLALERYRFGTSGRGSGTKPWRFGICTAGRVLESMTASSGMILFW